MISHSLRLAVAVAVVVTVASWCRAQSSASSERDARTEAMRSRFEGRGGSSDRGRSSRPDSPGRFGPLVNAITTIVEPDSWDRAGGPGSIVAIDSWGVLIVNQTADIHQRIENLITTVRRARLQQSGDGDGSSECSTAIHDTMAVRPVSLASESLAISAGRKKIEQALSSKISLDFADVPLSEVAKHIQEKCGITVLLDKASLEDEELDTDHPVTFSVQDISLRSALMLMFRDLGLTYCIEYEVLLITTPLRAEEELHARVYMVEDLAVPLEKVTSGRSGPQSQR